MNDFDPDDATGEASTSEAGDAVHRHGYFSEKERYLVQLRQIVALGLLDDQLAHCVIHAAAAGGPEADGKMKEASEAISRLVCS